MTPLIATVLSVGVTVALVGGFAGVAALDHWIQRRLDKGHGNTYRAGGPR